MSKYTNIEAVKNYVELARMNLIKLGFNGVQAAGNADGPGR